MSHFVFKAVVKSLENERNREHDERMRDHLKFLILSCPSGHHQFGSDDFLSKDSAPKISTFVN